jgi:hypothetical protein
VHVRSTRHGGALPTSGKGAAARRGVDPAAATDALRSGPPDGLFALGGTPLSPALVYHGGRPNALARAAPRGNAAEGQAGPPRSDGIHLPQPLSSAGRGVQPPQHPDELHPHLSQTHVLKPSSGRDSSHRHCQPDVRAVPRCRSVSAGLLAVKAKPLRGGLRPALTAPTPSGIGSYARNREKTGQHPKKPIFKPALRSSRSTVYSRDIRTDTAGGNHGTSLCSR